MAHTQENRLATIATPLGTDVLLLEGFSGTEGISELFRFDLRLLADVDKTIDFDAIVGKSVTVEIFTPGGPRFFNGLISRFAEGSSDNTFTSYSAELVPWLWMLTRTADCRIFQELTVPDIIRKVFTDLGFTDVRFELTGSYQPREYCVQYRETDFNFVSRLMEQYGIFYYFEHENGKHTMVLADAPASHKPCPLQPRARFHQISPGETLVEHVVTEWQKVQEIRSGKYALQDFNFETPSLNLMVNVESQSPGSKLEIYDYPGEYQKLGEGEALVRARIEEEECQRTSISGAGTCVAFTAGYKFDLAEHTRASHNGSYVLTRIRHVASEPGYRSQDAGEFQYDNTFTCIPARVPFRPPRRTLRPVVEGPQTAEVVGVAGEEIHTDKYGRVKVQFHWDREGKHDEKSSCWIRVSQPWAGKNWGSVAIPRIGQEVVVDFLEGDPDQPIITGRVYNGEAMPPYSLPAGGVVSGLKSNSTKGGGGYNEISMDDTKGKEQVTVHAQYDMSTTIEHDDTQKVVNNRSIAVDGTHNETVKKDIVVNSADSFYHLTAKTDIVLTVGASKITMKSDGTIEIEGVNIAVKGTDIGVNGTANVKIKGGQVSSEADGNHNTKGAIVMSEGAATNTVKGGMVMLNP
jgi:type VI secretion system secreted protein VgrG